MAEGWIRLHRKITENALYFSEPFTRMGAWFDLLILANHTEGFIYVRGNRVVVGRGQVGWSQQSLAERWKWSRGKVIRFLSELENDQQIVQQKNNITSLISIVNYDMYQSDGTTKCTSDKTTDGPQTDHRRYTNNNDNNDNNEYYPFEQVWNDYDKKVGDRDKLRNKWAGVGKIDRKLIQEYIPKYIASEPDKKYRKHFETFLNNKSWNDEIIQKTNGQQKPKNERSTSKILKEVD